ncbi:MAG: serine/threonine-protein kinase [Candidatus Eisenbacteria bacterium]
MDPETWQRIETVFFQALDRPEDERGAFLVEACRDEPELRREVEDMLAATSDESRLRVERVLIPDDGLGVTPGGKEGAPPNPGGTGPGPPHPGAPMTHGSMGRPGTVFGAWRLESLLGSGGMGEVWFATRADGAYEAVAALKIVRPGFRAAQLVPRFVRERQVLARLRHPNIATLLDGGVTHEGLPYLVMEFVEGEPITTWCRRKALGLEERLDLFRTVCEAVQFAHSNLVVHRDLKPQNIFVTRDGRPVLLDFGIAKLLDAEGDDGLTRAEERLLTPEHSAPEQIRGETTTTAADVWSLGVLLYELLTDQLPFRSETPSTRSIQERVQFDEPPPPSRATPSSERARGIRGDLDRIVLMALRKEPERRYHSAEALAEDVDRFRRGDAVQAAPDTPTYRLRTMVRRHRTAVVMVSGALLLLVSFAATAVWQAERTRVERDAALVAREDADQAVSMLVDLFRVANPQVVPGGDTLRVADLISLAEQQLENTEETPRVQATLWKTLAAVHGVRSRYPEQKAALARALEAAERAGMSDEILTLQHEVARLVLLEDGPNDAEPLFRASLARHEARYGPDAPDVAIAAQDLASCAHDPAEQRQLLERALAIARRSLKRGEHTDSLGLASALNGLGTVYWQQGEQELAVRTFEETYELLEELLPLDHPHLLSVRSNVAVGLEAMGEFEEAQAVHRELLLARRRVFGEEAAPVAASLLNVGHCLAHAGRFDEAILFLQESVDLATRLLGPENETTSRSALDLSVALVRAGRIEEGFETFERSAVWIEQSAPSAAVRLDIAIRRAGLELDAGRSVSLDSLRSWVAELGVIDGDLIDRARAFRTLGAAALRNPESARPGEADASFTQAARLLEGRVFERHPLFASVRCGAEVSRAEAGLPFDHDELEQSLALSSGWGLADPELARRGRKILATRGTAGD